MQGLCAAYWYLQRMHGSRLNGYIDTSAKPSKKNVKIQYCILYIFYKHLADAGPKDGKRLIAVSLCKQNF